MALPEDEEGIEAEARVEGEEVTEVTEGTDVKSETPKEESQDSKE